MSAVSRTNGQPIGDGQSLQIQQSDRPVVQATANSSQGATTVNPRVTSAAKDLFSVLNKHPELLVGDARNSGALQNHNSEVIDLKKSWADLKFLGTKERLAMVTKHHSRLKIFGAVVGAVVVGAAVVAAVVALSLSGAVLALGAVVALVLLAVAFKEWKKEYKPADDQIKSFGKQIEEGKEDLRTFFTLENKKQIIGILQGADLNEAEKGNILTEFNDLMNELYPTEAARNEADQQALKIAGKLETCTDPSIKQFVASIYVHLTGTPPAHFGGVSCCGQLWYRYHQPSDAPMLEHAGKISSEGKANSLSNDLKRFVDKVDQEGPKTDVRVQQDRLKVLEMVEKALDAHQPKPA